MSKRTQLFDLPPGVLKKINKEALNFVPFTYRLDENGRAQRNSKYHNFSKNKMYGTHVLPLSALMEVHPQIKTKLKKKPSGAWTLRSAGLPGEVVQHVNAMSRRKRSPMRLPVMYYESEIKRKPNGTVYYTPATKSTRKTKWLMKSDYVPVVYNVQSGISKVVKDDKIKSTRNVKFIHKMKLKLMPSDF